MDWKVGDYWQRDHLVLSISPNGIRKIVNIKDKINRKEKSGFYKYLLLVEGLQSMN